MYKNILVPVAPEQERDPGEALDLAHKLVDSGGNITVLSVLERLPGYVEAHIPEGQMEQNLESIASALEEFDARDLRLISMCILQAGSCLGSLLRYR